MSVLEEVTTRLEQAEERRSTARARHDEKIGEAEQLLASIETEGRELTAEDETRHAAILAEADQAEAERKDAKKLAKRLAERLEEEKEAAERRKQMQAARSAVTPDDGLHIESVNEPMVYGPESENSYVNDFVRFYGGPSWAGHEAAGKRLAEWQHQVEREIARDEKAPSSKAALKICREKFRESFGDRPVEGALKEVVQRGRTALEDKPELRAIGTDGGASATAPGEGSAFVSPVFFVQDYAAFREFGRAFANACRQEPLPPYGMNVYIPQVTGGAEVGELTESSGSTAVSEKAVTAGYLEGGVKTFAGEMIVSQQLLDRAGPNFAFDKLVFDQLDRNYALRWDKYVLTRALTAPQKQNWVGNAGTFVFLEKGKAGGFVGQVNQAQAAIREKAGTVLNPTHIFMTPGRYSYISAFADENGRLQVNADYQGPFAAAAAGGNGNPGIEGDTGLTLGGLPVCQDANIPGVGTYDQDQVIVGCLSEVWCFEGNVVPRVLPQTKAQNLQVILQEYAYGVAIPRYPEGIVTLEGTGLKKPVYEH